MKNILLLIAICNIKVGLSQFLPRNIIDSNATGITEIITSDLNNDNFDDILVSQKYIQNNKISFYLNLGNGFFGNQQVIDTNIFFPPSITSADFDGNGWNDIVTLSGTSSSGKLFLYNNTSGVLSPQIILDSNLFYSQNVKSEDLDNDNDIDIILIIDTALIVYYNDSFGNFTKNVVPSGILTEYYAVDISDIDNDSYKDIVIGGTRAIIYKNTMGVISFDSIRTYSIPDNYNLVFLVHLKDFDNDGDFDLITDKNVSNLIQWYSNDGFGFFSTSTLIDSNASQCFSISSADFDDDGDFDLFTALPQLGRVVWYKNDGNGNFGLPLLIYQGSIPETNEVFSDDLNNDGLPDLIWSRELSCHLNNFNNLGIIESSTENTIKAYPNPVTNRLNIEVINDQSQLFIYNNIGQAVISNIKLTAGFNFLDLNLKSGYYMLVISDEISYMHQKILIK